MRKTINPKAWMCPNPVLIIACYKENDEVSIMNAAWGGVVDNDLLGITISKSHDTTKSILNNKYFTVSIGTKQMVTSCDYVGIVSGNKEKDKFKKSGFTCAKSANINAPIINELPLCFECKLEKYDDQLEYMLCKIEHISIDDSIIDMKGNIDMDKFSPIVFNPLNNTYQQLGSIVDKAFSCGLNQK